MKRIIVIRIVILVLSCTKKAENDSGYVPAVFRDTAVNSHSSKSSHEMVKLNI